MDVTIGAIQRIFNNLISIVNQTLDGYVIGSITPAAGTFTTINGTFQGTFNGALAINSGTAYCGTNSSFVSTTTVGALAGLSIPLGLGTYEVSGYIPVSVGTEGPKVTLVGTNSLAISTASNITGWSVSAGTVNANPVVNALATDLAGSAAATTCVEFDGTIVVTTAGTLGVSAAQHTASTTTTTLGAGGYLRVNRIA